MLRRCDRYLLREMVGPFLLALTGLVLFILLNIILSLSDLMVDRGIGMLTLLRLVLLKMPSLLVIAVPMSALFATFLGLGRLAHDREIVALESIGIPLRRILLPLVLASIVIGVADFAIYNWAVPASEHAYQQELRSVIFRQGVPRITANAFFKGADNQFFYIRRYDEAEGTLHDVHIYDTTGTLFPHADSRVTLITAETGRWTGESWELVDGNAYGFDAENLLAYSGTFERLSIPLDQSVEQVLSRSRTPAEMGIAELVDRIANARAAGQRADEYIVEAHLKAALPLATLVFVLFGGTVSLVFSPRSRSAGIVLGMLLVGLFQGALWWTQTLGRRGAIDPALAAWIPDLVFGALGIVLFLRVDRLANRDLWSRLRAKVAWFSVLSVVVISLGFVSTSVLGRIEAPDHTEPPIVRVQDGSQHLAWEAGSIRAEVLSTDQSHEGTWHVVANGDVHLEWAGAEIRANHLSAEFVETLGSMEIRTLDGTSVRAFVQQPVFASATPDFRFEASHVRMTFDEAGRVHGLQAEACRLVMCDGCEGSAEVRPCTFRADALRVFDGDLLVARNLTAHLGPLPALWLPVYVHSMSDPLDVSAYPTFGRNDVRGWFAQWSIPFFLSENLFGALRFDHFSADNTLGMGSVIRYGLGEHAGTIAAYGLDHETQDSFGTLELKHIIDLGAGWQGLAEVSFEREATRKDLTFGALIEGHVGDMDLALSLSRETRTRNGSIRIEERLPELRLKTKARRWGKITLRPELGAGWIRVLQDQAVKREGLRLSGLAQILPGSFRIVPLVVTPEIILDAAAYGRLADGSGWDHQVAADVILATRHRGISLGWASTFVHGVSPYAFDRREAEHGIRWKIEREAPKPLGMDAQIKGSFCLEDGLDQVEFAIGWDVFGSWRFQGDVDPRTGMLEGASLKGSHELGARSVRWRLPFDGRKQSFDAARLDLTATSDRATLDLSTEFDLVQVEHIATYVETSLSLGDGWGAKLAFDVLHSFGTLANLRYGVYVDLTSCVRIGAERDGGDAFLYATLVGFPDAILRFIPHAALDPAGQP